IRPALQPVMTTSQSRARQVARSPRFRGGAWYGQCKSFTRSAARIGSFLAFAAQPGADVPDEGPAGMSRASPPSQSLLQLERAPRLGDQLVHDPLVREAGAGRVEEQYDDEAPQQPEPHPPRQQHQPEAEQQPAVQQVSADVNGQADGRRQKGVFPSPEPQA